MAAAGIFGSGGKSVPGWVELAGANREGRTGPEGAGLAEEKVDNTG